MDDFLTVALNPFLDWMLLAFTIGQFMKAFVWTKERARSGVALFGKQRLGWFFKFARRTLSFHPVVAGVLVGHFWPGDIQTLETVAFVGGTFKGMLYFGMAGLIASWGYASIKKYLQSRGIDLDPSQLPGMSSAPPPAPERDTPVDKPS